MTGRPVPEHERGAALLAVLLLVSVMGAISAVALQKLRLATSLAANVVALDQARAFAMGVESLIVLTIDDLTAHSPDKTTLAGGWNGAQRRYPMPGGGLAQATVRDGGNCFNVNSLVEGAPGAYRTRPAGVAQFVALMRLLEIPEGSARRIAEASADWADSDEAPNREGAEDPQYLGSAAPYRTGNTLFGEVSELRAVAAMTPEVYARVRPWLCALPAAELSPINVNTLSAEQAPLLAMLAPETIRIDLARRLLTERPESGFDDLLDFWDHPALENAVLAADVQLQPQLKTNWFAIELQVELEGAELFETALIDARRPQSRLAVRRWGLDE